MPNIATVLREEIRRLARKEVRAQVAELKSASGRYRKDIAALKRRISEQDRALARLDKPRSKPASQAGDGGASLRFSPGWVASHREKLELSAADYAALVGVSMLTVYNWEKGKSRPQRKQLEALSEVKKLGKREARTRLEALE